MGRGIRILAFGVTQQAFPDDDLTYLVNLVAATTGITPAEATPRVNEVIVDAQTAAAEARQAAEDAREAAAALSLYTFISLLIGAFIACVAAALGGRQRDGVPVIVI